MIEADKTKAENERKNIELARCFKRMAKTDDGKKIMKDLEWMCCHKRTSIGPANDPERWNTNQCFYHEGMRNVYLYVLGKINRKENEND